MLNNQSLTMIPVLLAAFAIDACGQKAPTEPTSADPAASCINGAAALWGDGSSFVLGARGPVMKSQFRLHPLRLTINGGPTGGPG